MIYSNQFSDNLILTQRTFHFVLVVTHHIKAVRCHPADAVKHEDTLITPVEDYIIPMAFCVVCLLDQCFIPSGNKERVHAVTLRLDADNISLPEKLFQIDFNWV